MTLQVNNQQNDRANDVVVLDVGGTHVRIGHLRDNKPHTDFTTLYSSKLRVDNAYDVLSDIIKHYASEFDLTLKAVVLGLPGMLDQQADKIAHCNNIRQLEGHGLQSRLHATLNCKVILEQDIMLQVLGEWTTGAAKSSSSVFGVYYGTGIGAAYLVDGNPKVHSAAGLQAGHIPIMAQGKPCICGSTDCIEAYACGHTLLEIAQAHNCPVEQLFTIKDNDALQAELDTFIQYQAYLIATLVTLFVPDTILVGGGIPQMNAYPRDMLIQQVQAHLQKPYPAETTHFVWATLGKSSVLHGARALLQMP
ncbi:MAG: ROK family protein [Granulosicoccus sp.]